MFLFYISESWKWNAGANEDNLLQTEAHHAEEGEKLHLECGTAAERPVMTRWWPPLRESAPPGVRAALWKQVPDAGPWMRDTEGGRGVPLGLYTHTGPRILLWPPSWDRGPE